MAPCTLSSDSQKPYAPQRTLRYGSVGSAAVTLTLTRTLTLTLTRTLTPALTQALTQALALALTLTCGTAAWAVRR